MRSTDHALVVIRAALPPSEAEGLARALASAGWRERARVMKREGSAEVLAGDSTAGAVVVKSLRVGGSGASWLRRLLRRSRLEREWAGGHLLARAGIDVAPMLALWRWRDERGVWIESLAMRRVEGPTLLEAMAEAASSCGMDAAGGPTLRAGSESSLHRTRHGVPSHQRKISQSEALGSAGLARAAGGLVARVLAAGLFNRDQKPSNIIVARGVDFGAGGEPRLVVIDPVGVRGRGLMRESAARRRMLFSLIVEPVGCGIDVPLRARLEAMHAAVGDVSAGEARRLVREDFRAIDQMLFEHGDPTPRVNPLGGMGG